MNESEQELWPLIIHMCLAAFLAKDPANQIRKIAKGYLRKQPRAKCKNSLKKIVKSRDPVSVVILVNEDINNDSQNKCEKVEENACAHIRDEP